jgi:hypothetical protein
MKEWGCTWRALFILIVVGLFTIVAYVSITYLQAGMVCVYGENVFTTYAPGVIALALVFLAIMFSELLAEEDVPKTYE